MNWKEIYLITWWFWSGKTHLAVEVTKKLLSTQKSSLSVVIFDFVSRAFDVLRFPQPIQDSVIIEPVWCSWCNDIESYAHSIINHTTELLVVEIPADRINISWLANTLSSIWCSVHILSVLQTDQNLTPFEESNIHSAGKIIDRSQNNLYINLLWNWFNESLSVFPENIDRNHVAGWLIKPIVSKESLISFFQIYKDTITRLKWQFYDNLDKVWYDIEYAQWSPSIQFNKCESMDYRSHSIAITSKDSETRTSFNKQFMLASKDWYVKNNTITRDVTLVYDVLLWNLNFDSLWNNMQDNFTEEHVFYWRLFRKEFDEYTKDIITEDQKLEYTKKLLFYRANQIIQWWERYAIDGDKYLILSIIMYALDHWSDKRLYITEEIRKQIIDYIDKYYLQDIVQCLIDNIPCDYNEDKPYEYRPSVISNYKNILLKL